MSPEKQIRTISNFIALGLFQLCALICQMLAIFQELNSKGLNLSSQKQEENRCDVFTSSIKREIRKFHVVVVQ